MSLLALESLFFGLKFRHGDFILRKISFISDFETEFYNNNFLNVKAYIMNINFFCKLFSNEHKNGLFPESRKVFQFFNSNVLSKLMMQKKTFAVTDS